MIYGASLDCVAKIESHTCMATENENGVIRLLRESVEIALRIFRRNPADGSAWLRAIAARDALHRSMNAHPAGKAAK